jgi:hypothetical protein
MTDWRVWWWLGFLPLGVLAALLVGLGLTVSLYAAAPLGGVAAAALLWWDNRVEIEIEEARALGAILAEIAERPLMTGAERARLEAGIAAAMQDITAEMARIHAQMETVRAGAGR